MSTVLVYPPAGVHGFGRYRTITRVVRPLSPAAASAIAQQLAGEGIDVLIEAGPIVHVIAQLPVTTWQEVHALGAVFERTDARVVWHGAVAS